MAPSVAIMSSSFLCCFILFSLFCFKFKAAVDAKLASGFCRLVTIFTGHIQVIRDCLVARRIVLICKGSQCQAFALCKEALSFFAWRLETPVKRCSAASLRDTSAALNSTRSIRRAFALCCRSIDGLKPITHFVLIWYSSVQDICLVACGLWLVSIDTKLAYAFRAQEIWLV